MLDPQLLRAEAESVAERLTVKKYILDVEKLGSLEDQRKGLQSEVQDLQAERNRSAKEVGRRKAAGEDVSGLIEETSGLAGKISAI
ncbi:MAG TPA: serine--tRNA ligase, partial [Gammaproteobacteria bacterium]|nr:serine--tRNA ligase [Gammaproteobacteria bacterium]